MLSFACEPERGLVSGSLVVDVVEGEVVCRKSDGDFQGNLWALEGKTKNVVAGKLEGKGAGERNKYLPGGETVHVAILSSGCSNQQPLP